MDTLSFLSICNHDDGIFYLNQLLDIAEQQGRYPRLGVPRTFFRVVCCRWPKCFIFGLAPGSCLALTGWGVVHRERTLVMLRWLAPFKHFKVFLHVAATLVEVVLGFLIYDDQLLSRSGLLSHFILHFNRRVVELQLGDWSWCGGETFGRGIATLERKSSLAQLLDLD